MKQVPSDRPSGKGVLKVAEKNREGSVPATGDRSTYAVLSLIAVLLVFGLVFPAAAAGSTVIITGYEVNPPVILPGEIGTITVTLKNTANQAMESESDTFTRSTGSTVTTTSTDISAKIESAILVGKGVEVVHGSFQDVGSIGPGQSFPLTFQIRAPAGDGIYFPEVWISVRGGDKVRYPIPVNVNSAALLPKNPAITVEKSVPESVSPGDDFVVCLTLTNTGEIRANNIDAVVHPNTSAVALKSPGTYHLVHLDPGASRDINFSFTSDRNAPSGLEVISVPIGYVRADGSRFEQVEQVGINLQGKAALSISAVSTDPSPAVSGGPFTLILRIENTGTGDATALKVRIDAPVSGSKQAFVGKIKPGSDAPAVFTLRTDQSGEIPVTVNLSYEDYYGPHSRIEEMALVVNPSAGPWAALAVLGLVIVGAALAYRHLRGRKETDHA